MADEEGRQPLCWIVTQHGHYYPLIGTADWKGCYFRQDLAKAAFEALGQGMYQTRALIGLYDDGTWEEVEVG